MTPFPPAFRTLLKHVLRRAPRVRGGRERDLRARRRMRAQSGTFSGHRAYAPGDDLRRVDWNAYARTGDVFTKVLEEEDRRILTVCIDSSRSMATGEPDRFVGAQRLAAILGGLALARLDGLRLVADRDTAWVWQGAESLAPMLDAIASLAVGDAEEQSLARATLEHGPTGAICWVSDFAHPECAQPALRLFRQHGRSVTGFLPQVHEDLHPASHGWVRLSDPETGAEEIMQVDAALRVAMEEELAILRRQQDAVLRELGYPLVRFPLPDEGDFTLASWYDRRWLVRV